MYLPKYDVIKMDKKIEFCYVQNIGRYIQIMLKNILYLHYCIVFYYLQHLITNNEVLASQIWIIRLEKYFLTVTDFK